MIYAAQIGVVRLIQGRVDDVVALETSDEANPLIPAWKASLAWTRCWLGRGGEAAAIVADAARARDAAAAARRVAEEARRNIDAYTTPQPALQAAPSLDRRPARLIPQSARTRPGSAAADERYGDPDDHEQKNQDAVDIRSLAGPAPLPGVSTKGHDPHDERKQ